MLRKLNIIIFIVITFSCFLKSQIIEPLYNYATSQLSSGKYYFDEGLLKKSEQELATALNKFPETVNKDEAIMLQSMIDQSYGNNKISEVALSRFIKENPNSPVIAFASMQRAYLAFEMKNYDLAEKLFGESKKISDIEFQKRYNPVLKELSNNALYWRGVSLSQRGKYQEAQQYFEECYRNYPNGKYADDALFALGMGAEVNRHFDEALTYFRTLQKSYPYSNSFIASRVREINDNLILRDPVSALVTIESTEQILKRIKSRDSIGLLYEPQSFSGSAAEEIMYLKGEAYNLSGNYEQAASFFKGFIETFTQSDLINYVRLGYAWALLNKAEYEEAFKTYNSIIETEKLDDSRVKALALLYRAITLKRMGNLEQARKELSNLSVESGFPFLSQVLLELGQIYYESGEFDKSAKTLDRAERDANEALVQIRIQLLSGASYLELKKWDKAIIAYKTAEQIALKSNYIFMPQKDFYLSQARLKLGIAYVRNSRNSEAISPLLGYLSDNKNSNSKDEALFWLSEAYYRSDLLNNAIEKYSSIVDLYPKSTYREDALYGLGWSYFRMKNFEKSSEVFGTMIKEFPNSKYALEVLTRQGDGYYITRNYRKAVDSYRKAAQLAPNTEEGQYSSYQLSHALYQMGSFDESITASLSFVRNYPKSEYASQALYLTGWIRFNQKKYSEAIQDFQFLLQAYPQSIMIPRAHFAIADAYYNLQNYELAINEYKTVMDEYPNSPLAPDALKSIQYCYTALGKDDEAMKIADTYVSSNPNSPYAADFKFKKGEMFYTGKNYHDAVTEYDNFIKNYPDNDKNAEAMFWMGKSYENLDDLDKADQTFQQIPNKYPKSDFAPQSLLERSLIKKQRADISSADSLLQQVQQLYPDNPSAGQAGFERANIKYSMGDSAGAISIFKDIAKKYKGMDYGGQSTYRIAMYFKVKGWLDSALIQFNIIANQTYNLMLASEAQFRIGEIYMRLEDLSKAIDAFIMVKEKFAGIEDWYTLSLLNLGECYEKTNDNSKAIEIYRALVTLRPDDDFGKTAKRRLKELEK